MFTYTWSRTSSSLQGHAPCLAPWRSVLALRSHPVRLSHRCLVHALYEALCVGEVSEVRVGWGLEWGGWVGGWVGGVFGALKSLKCARVCMRLCV